MIAKVYAMKRLPRRFSVFDYAVPEGLNVARGQMVEIPFRNKTIHGIVAGVQEKSEETSLKEIVGVVEEIRLREEELAFFESLAFDLAQSVPSLLYQALPTPPKRQGKARVPPSTALRISKDDIEELKRLSNQPRLKRGFRQVSDLRRMTALILATLTKNPHESALVLVPTTRDAKLVAAHLGSLKPCFSTGEESNNQRYEAWKAFRTGECRLFVGTRTAAFLTRPDLTSIFVLRSSHPSHKQQDRNPRYDTRTVALARAEHGANLIFMDDMIRPEDMLLFSKDERDEFVTPVETILIPMNKERATAPHPLLGSSTVRHIEEGLAGSQRVLCVYNRKDEKLATLHEAFANLIPQFPAGFLNKEHPQDYHEQLLITTEHYRENVFNAFMPGRLGLIVLLNADGPLHEKTFRAKEHALRTVSGWRGVAAAARCPLLIQTDSPDVFSSYFENPDQVLQEELEMRISYGYPPKRRFMRITTKEGMALLETLKIQIIETEPSAEARIQEETLFVAVDPDQTQGLLELFSTLDDHYIIDTAAFS